MLNELKFMLDVGDHENILTLVGVCKDSLPNDFCIVVEYCALGSLVDYIYNCRGIFVNECLKSSDVIRLDTDDTIPFVFSFLNDDLKIYIHFRITEKNRIRKVNNDKFIVV